MVESHVRIGEVPCPPSACTLIMQYNPTHYTHNLLSLTNLLVGTIQVKY
jgi:hypothetical protein